jgi:hypothetical protein
MLHVPRERHTVRRAIHEASQHGVDVAIFRPPQMDGVKGKEAHLAKTKEIYPKSAIIISAMYTRQQFLLPCCMHNLSLSDVLTTLPSERYSYWKTSIQQTSWHQP